MTEPAHFRDLLIGLQSRAAARIDRLETELDKLARARRDGSDDDEHDPDEPRDRRRQEPLEAQDDPLRERADAARDEQDRGGEVGHGVGLGGKGRGILRWSDGDRGCRDTHQFGAVVAPIWGVYG